MQTDKWTTQGQRKLGGMVKQFDRFILSPSSLIHTTAHSQVHVQEKIHLWHYGFVHVFQSQPGHDYTLHLAV